LARDALGQRYGVRPHSAYGWDVIEIPTVRPVIRRVAPEMLAS
jgi:hypothetical protein